MASGNRCRNSVVLPARRGPVITIDYIAAGDVYQVNLTFPLFIGYRNTYQVAAAQTQADLAVAEALGPRLRNICRAISDGAAGPRYA